MNICWRYLDKRGATIDALKDYESMKYIIDHTEEQIAEKQEDMAAISSPVLSGMPKGSRNPQAAEDRVLKGIDAIDVLEARYQDAMEYMAWFQPAWEALSEDESYVLSLFYQNEDSKQIDNLYEICEHFHIERTSAYKKKDRALAHLTLLLYGK